MFAMGQFLCLVVSGKNRKNRENRRTKEPKRGLLLDEARHATLGASVHRARRDFGRAWIAAVRSLDVAVHPFALCRERARVVLGIARVLATFHVDEHRLSHRGGALRKRVFHVLELLTDALP